VPFQKGRKKDPNWPGILESDEGQLSENVFRFYDGGTYAVWKRVRDDCTWRGTWAVDTAYNQKDALLHNSALYICSVTHGSTPEKEPGAGGPWLHIADDVTYDASSWQDDHDYAAKVFLINAGTGYLSTEAHHSEQGWNDPGTWQDCTYFSSGELELKSSKLYSVNPSGVMGYEWLCSPTLPSSTWTYQLYGNIAAYDAEALAADWGVDNEWRLTRKPIGLVLEDARDEDLRWDFNGEYNIRLRLKADFESDPKYDVSPDLKLDDEMVGPVRVIEGESEVQPASITCRMPTRRYHIKIDEIGTRSVANYANVEYNESAPEDQELLMAWDFIYPEGVFWCPFDTSDTENFKVTASPSYDAEEVTRAPIPVGGRRIIQLFLMPRRWAYYGRNYVAEVENGPHVYCNCWYGGFLWLDTIPFATHYTQYMGLWYDRWPNSFELGNAGIEDGNPYIYVAVPFAADYYDTNGDSSEDSVIEDYEALGLNTDDVIAGANAINVFCHKGTWSDAIYIRYADRWDDWGGGWYYPLFWSRANMKAVDTSPGCGYSPYEAQRECFAATDDVWTPIWDKVEHSDFYAAYGIDGDSLPADPDYTFSDGYPYGIGLVATQAGDLVGVIKAGGQMFYVWRRTTETLELKCPSTNPVPDRPYGFETNSEDDFISYDYSVYYNDCFAVYGTSFPLCPFESTDGRKITGAFRPLPTSLDDTGHADPGGEARGAQYTLPVPVFVMGGRERYFDDGRRAWRYAGWFAPGDERSEDERNRR